MSSLTPSPTSSHDITVEIPPPASSSTVQQSTYTHPMITHSRDGIVKHRIIHSLCAFPASSWFHAHFTIKEPHGFKSAIKNPAWLSAMDEKMATLK